MTSIFADVSVVWAVVLVLLVPALVVGAGELDERLRQRGSSLRPLLTVLRWWTLPLLVVWIVARAVLGAPPTLPLIRLLATALLLSVAVAALAALRVVVSRYRGDHSTAGRGRVPQLLLVLPRLGVVLVVGWLLLDRVWGVDLSAALTALGVGSLVVSFALQDTLSGLASGLLLLGDAPFRPGDWIRYGEATEGTRPEGRVVDINWRSTRIENRDGDLVIVPNATLATATLINFDRPTRVHRVVVPVQVAYVNPPTRAKEMLLDAARSTPHVLDDPAPRVHVVQVDDPLMGYEAHLWIDDYRLAPQVSSDFSGLVWYQSHRHDVPLPSPAYDLYVYDGVAAGEAGRPDRDEIGRRLRTSPLLDQLAHDELERLAAAGRALRFARRETIVSAEARSDLYVLWSGRAHLVVADADADADADGEDVAVGELGPGDVFGLLGRPVRIAGAPRIQAVTDCEVVAVDAAAAAEVTSRNPALSAAIEQILARQRQRVERVGAGRTDVGTPVTDGQRPRGDDAATATATERP